MWPVIDLIPLIGWKYYSIQTGENISTNESTRIYNGNMVYNPTYH